MFSARELELMAPKEKKPKKEVDISKPPNGLTAKEKRIWIQKQKEAADRAAFRQFEKEKRDALNTPEEKAKRKQAQLDADLKKLSSPKRTKATDPTDRPLLPKKKPAKKTLDQKDIDYFTKYANITDTNKTPND